MSLKINILSPGRFHVCDLARELDKTGFDVKFYSFVPKKRALKFGLPEKCSASILFLIAPFLILEKIIFKKKQWARKLRVQIQDYITGIYMRKCDILIAMSGDFVFSLEQAKKNNSIVILERGSKHILEQKKVLDNITAKKNKTTVPEFNIRREIKGYNIADYISVASKHVKESFIKNNFNEDKLFQNPYGVDLKMFKPTIAEKEYDLIMVGGWSYRKGCDLIEDVINELNLKFLHVGSLVDLEFPKGHNFTHINSVDQTELIKYYNKAKCFILPSREEGLAMVQAQAIACNVPIIGSYDSGAFDLKQMVEDPTYIELIDDYSKESIINAINKIQTLDLSKQKDYAGHSLKNLTWDAYGKRYSNFLKDIKLDK